MEMEKYYMNCSTGEITESHRTACEWYRSGDSVETWKDGRMILKWESLF